MYLNPRQVIFNREHKLDLPTAHDSLKTLLLIETVLDLTYQWTPMTLVAFKLIKHNKIQEIHADKGLPRK